MTKPDSLEYVVKPFPTNGDRFAASELRKRLDSNAFPRSGFLLQALAAGWHHKSTKQLEELADRVGRERIMVLHGTRDRMITFPHGETLVKDLGGEERGVTKRFVEGQAHVIAAEMRDEFNSWLEELIDRTEDLNRRESK